jgi:hypothetical protein
MIVRAFAAGVALLGLAACDAVRPAGNPLLQSREGRREVVNLCHDAVQDRIANVDSLRFARGEIVNTDDFGEATYYGAVEGLASGNARRYSFMCRVQPSGLVDITFR